MKGLLLAIVLLAGCIDEFEAPQAADCELVTPTQVALGEPFVVEVRCADLSPAWFDFDFGDGSDGVRTSETVREHTYGDHLGDHLWFRVQVFYVDGTGHTREIEAIVDRRFD